MEERDLAGNWSDPSGLAIKFDMTKPVVAFTAPQVSGTFYASSGTVNLAGTAKGPVAIANLPLVENVPAVVPVIATDNANNTGEATLTLQMDNTIPTPPAIIIAPATPTKNATGAWSWAAGSDGTAGSGLSGMYRYALNGSAWKDTVNFPAAKVLITNPSNDNILTGSDNIDVAYTMDGAAGSKNFKLVEGSNTLTVTSPPNESGVTGSASVKVTRDMTKPNAAHLEQRAGLDRRQCHLVLDLQRGQ